MPLELSLPAEAISLSKGDSGRAFQQAALTIMQRSVPYMGGDQISDQPAHSVAEGLAEKLGIPLKPDNLFFAHGLEQSFQFSAKLIDMYAQLIRRLFEQAEMESPEIVMLFRTPAHNTSLKQFEGLSFKCEMIETYDQMDMWENGPYSFGNFIEFLNHSITPRPPLPFESSTGRLIIGLFDANPSVSTGHVRTKEETAYVADMLDEARQRNMEIMKALIGEDYVKNFREMFFVVEDQTLRGLEYDGEKVTSFACLPDYSDITHTVFGVSECGLSGMQGSVTVMPPTDAAMLKKRFNETQTSLSALSVFSCEYMFGTNPEDRENREKFFKNRVAHCRQSAAIAHAIINGSAEDLLSPKERETALQWLHDYGALTQQEAQQLLEKGIPSFRALHMPQAGYYLFVDYEQLIKFHEDETNWDKTQVIEVISNLAHDNTGMAIGSGIDMGLRDSAPAFRMNVDLPPDQLIDRLFRLRKLVDTVKAHGPVLTLPGKGRSLPAPGQQLRLTQQ